MKRLLEAAGIDVGQWWALTRAYALVDYAGLLGAYGAAEQRRAALRIAVSWGFMTMMGLGLAFTAWVSRDIFLAAAVLTTTMMMWGGLVVLTQSTTLLTPEDYAIIGFRPVSSRTYFAVRVTALLLQILESTILIGWLPVLAFLTRRGGSPLLAAAAIAAIAGSIAAVVFAIVALYGWLIRFIPPARLTRIVSIAGGFATVALSLGFMLATRHLMESDTPGAVFNRIVERDWRTMWFPGVWFASWVTLAAGSRSAMEVVTAVAALILVVALVAAVRGRMSVEYAVRLSEFEVLSKPQLAAPQRHWSALEGEWRAVALIVGSHLRGDTRFQMGIASNVIMGVAIAAMTSSYRWPTDPFNAGALERTQDLMAPMFALVFVPLQMYQALVLSPAYEASWPLFSTPADRAKLVIAGRDAIAVFVLLPVAVALAVFYTYAYGHAAHAVVHAILLGASAYVSLQLSAAVAPRLPFAVPVFSARERGFPFLSGMLVMLIGMPLFVLLQFIAYRNMRRVVITFALLAMVIWLLNAVTRQRIARSKVLRYMP